MVRLLSLFGFLCAAGVVAQDPVPGLPRSGPQPVTGPSDGPATPYVAPRVDGPVAVILDDVMDPLIPLLTNTGGGEAGQAHREDRDAYAGLHSLRVTPIQKYQPQLPGWGLKIVEKPTSTGEFRYARFAWKKIGGTGVMIQFHDSVRGWAIRYVAGPNTVGWEALTVAEKAPPGWDVVTCDLFKDYGPLTLTGIAFTPMDGEGALFDQVLLGRSIKDLDHYSDDTLGRLKPTSRLSDADRLTHWKHLTDRSGDKAAAALKAFLMNAPDSVAFIRQQLAHHPADEQSKRIATLIANLDANAFAVRQSASAELSRIGVPAIAALQEVVRTAPSPETTFRAEEILRSLVAKPGDVPPMAWKSARIVRILARAATPEATDLLNEMARGKFGPEFIADSEASLRALK